MRLHVGIVVLAVTYSCSKSNPDEDASVSPTRDSEQMKVAAPLQERRPLEEISSEDEDSLDSHSRMLAVLARLRKEAFQNSKYDGEGELRRL